MKASASTSATSSANAGHAGRDSSTDSDSDRGFRQFFQRMTTEQLQQIHDKSQKNTNKLRATAADTSATPASLSASSTIVPSSPLVLECYLQLQSSMPQLHAHHLTAFHEWIQQHISRAKSVADVMQLSVQPPGHVSITPLSKDQRTFMLTPSFLQAVRNQAQLPGAHSRLLAPASINAATTVTQSASTAASSDDAHTSEPTFAEALAAEKGNATISLSKVRSENYSTLKSTAASASSSSSSSASASIPASTPLDSRVHAAASLYASLTVHLLPLLLNPSTTLSQAAMFLEHIPLDVQAEAQRMQEEEFHAKASAPAFFIDESIHPPEVDEEPQIIVMDSEDESDYEPDTPPPDSDVDDEEGDGSGWCGLSDIPSDVQALENQIASRSTHPALQITWAQLQQKFTQIIHMWDEELFTTNSIFIDNALAEALLSIWRSVLRHKHFNIATNPEEKEQLRSKILRIFLKQMQNHPQSITVHLHAVVQQLLESPQRIPGMSTGTDDEDEEADADNEENDWREQNKFRPSETCLVFLSQLVQSHALYLFPVSPSTLPISSPVIPAAQSTALQTLHEFVKGNLAFLGHRLGKWRNRWNEFVESGDSVVFGTRKLRQKMHEFYAIIQLLAFYISHHLALKTQKGDSSDIGREFMELGITNHLVGFVLMHKHSLFHSHALSPEEVRQCCANCHAFEQNKSLRDLQVMCGVDSQGQVQCEIKPAISVFASSQSSSPAADKSLLFLPQVSSSPNPLALVHQLLLLAASLSKTVSQHLLAHPVFMSSIHCPCYEQQHVLSALLLPVVVSWQSIDTPMEQILRLIFAASNQTTASTSTSTSTASTDKKGVAKKKKSKLMVSAIEKEETSSSEASTSVGTVSQNDEFKWSDDSVNARVLFSALKRTQQVLTLASSDLASLDLTASSSATQQLAQIELLQHVVCFLYQVMTASPTRRVSFSLLASGAFPVKNSLEASRVEEKDTLQSTCQALLNFRHSLQPVARKLTEALSKHAAVREQQSEATDDDTAAALTALDRSHDSLLGHEARKRKMEMEAALTSVNKMQQWLKGIVMLQAKKD